MLWCSPSPPPVEIVFTTDRNYFYARWKLLLRCLLGGEKRKWMLSRLFASLRSALSERGGVSSVAIGFHPHGKIKICGHPSRLCHPCAIIHPGVLCGESMLAPHSYFKKMFFNTFWLSSVCVTLYIFLQKKSLNCLVRIKIRLTFASAFRKEAVLKKRSLKDLDMNKQVVQD